MGGILSSGACERKAEGKGGVGKVVGGLGGA